MPATREEELAVKVSQEERPRGKQNTHPLQTLLCECLQDGCLARDAHRRDLAWICHLFLPEACFLTLFCKS